MYETIMKKSSRARQSAFSAPDASTPRRRGRPPILGKPLRKVHLSLDDATLARAREIGKGVTSSGIRIAVAAYKNAHEAIMTKKSRARQSAFSAPDASTPRRRGRPPILGEPLKRVLVSLDQASIERARRRGRGNLSAGIRAALAATQHKP
ncbi:MAG TPA: hypothetical protein VNK67_05490 [Burkholderiales bacterium]|nr:hypothetical protein [Burkholderiales bacterium]